MKWLAIASCLFAWSSLPAADALPHSQTTARPGHALIIVGLPGDAEHDALFRETARIWRKALVGPLGFDPKQVRLVASLSGDPGLVEAPATRDSIAREVEALRSRATRADRVWVFVLGHASLDDGHAFLHLPGPDLRDDQFANLFGGFEAAEQVFWMTSSASGAFLPALSKPGRVVVAATEASGETNETEFPRALAETMTSTVDRLDRDKDGKVSVLEIILATTDAVDRIYKTSKRVPTEHAQFDDNGDGVGLEPKAERNPTDLDGLLASKTFLPMTGPDGRAPKTPPRSDHGTSPTVR